MKVLFTFFIPSGGVETLNRLRCSVLNQHGIEAHTLYLKPGTGMQNNTGTVFITNHDNEIKSLLDQQQYDAIIVTSDINMVERLRLVLDYRGRIIYEAQGLGTREAAIETICTAMPYLQAHANAVLIPPTAHLQQLFAEICPFMHRFIIPNMLDTTTFTPIDTDIPPIPPLCGLEDWSIIRTGGSSFISATVLFSTSPMRRYGYFMTLHSRSRPTSSNFTKR